MTQLTFKLTHLSAKQIASRAVLNAPHGLEVVIREPKRSVDQNAAQWPILQAFADQLEWPVNGRMTKLTPDEFKDILTAAFRKEAARLAMGLDGGVVMLGSRTSKFTKAQFSEYLEFLNFVAADRGVNLSREGITA